MTTDRCEISDLPRDQCAHCGASPGDRVRIVKLAPTSVTRVDIYGAAPLPSTWATRRDPAPLRLRDNTDGCGCGQPTRDHAYGCDDCANELTRTLADAPWIAEQLDVTVTGQRGKRPDQSGRATEGLPWNDKASEVLTSLANHLTNTVSLCHLQHVSHQSPYDGLPDLRFVPSMAQWLLWRVDGLTLNPVFTHTLRVSLAIEKTALGIIDRPPDRLFLGMCELSKLKLCDGAVYVKAGEAIGKCRECGMKYDAEDRRRSLEKALDDQLVTAADIARLATYLGIPAAREAVRKTVNRWHSRKVLVAKVLDPDGTPRFRYGDVAPLLSAAYDKKEPTR